MSETKIASRRILSVVGLLLVYALVRLHNLNALPLFIDESLYIETAQRVRDGQLLNSAVTNGRLLHVWYNALLGPYPPAVGWVMRAGMVLASMAGLAAFYGLVRAMVSHRAGLVAIVLWIAAPYLLFYERMTLGDTMLNAVSVVAVWWAWVTVRRGRWWMAIALGGMLVVVLLAKVSGLVLLPLALVTVLLMPDRTPRERLALGALAYGTFAAIWGPLLLVFRWKGYDYLALGSSQLGGVNQNIVERTWDNIQLVWGYDLAYLGLPVVLLAVLSGLWWLRAQPRAALFALLVLGMIAGGSVAFGRAVNARRILSHVPWVLLPLAVGVGTLLTRRPRWQPAIYAALAAWIVVFAGPFQLAAWNDPPALDLNDNDTIEYITHEASGYGVTEIGTWLRATDAPLPTLGFVANCLTLRWAAYPLDVTCPAISWDGSSQDRIMAQAENWAADGPIYVVGESLPYIDLAGLPQPHTVIERIARPGGHQPVILLRIEQGAQRPPGE